MNHAAIDHRLTADILTHAAEYMATLGPAHTCLYRRAGDDAAVRLSDYGPIDDDSNPELEAANRQALAGCCLLGAIQLAATDYGIDDTRTDCDLIQAALPSLLAASPLAISAPPHSPATVWHRLLPRASDAVVNLQGPAAGPTLARWLRQAAQHTIDNATVTAVA